MSFRHGSRPLKGKSKIARVEGVFHPFNCLAMNRMLNIKKQLSAHTHVAAAKSAGLKDDVKTLQAELATLSREQAEMDTWHQSKQFVCYRSVSTPL